MFGTVFAMAALHVLPRPAAITPLGCRAAGVPVPRTASSNVGAAAIEETNERWRALGIGSLRSEARGTIRVGYDRAIGSQSYDLSISAGGIAIRSGDDAGTFYAMMTLAQLPMRTGDVWTMPCVRIRDGPALKWRILSDDVSRGPLPTMRYFKERIRTIAAFKMNGYSPYMEHVFRSASDPLPAPLDGITPPQLAELARYGARFHVSLIPQQQTFAHMHNTLRLERYAPAAELPHGFLLAPNAPLTAGYLARIIGEERAAVPSSPFFHIGADETATLGEGTTAQYVAQHGGRSAVYAAHIRDMARLVAPSRVMLWDDGIENDPSIMAQIPRSAVIVNWHYGGNEPFERYIATIERGGLQQMVAPGASNWNEIYPQLAVAIQNERRFIDDGKKAGVLGLFQTTWHDDGETLFEATWYPVLYAAASAWERRDVDPARFSAEFPTAFFGSSDPGYARDMQLLGDAGALVGGSGNKRFWADPFDAFDASQMANVDLAKLRLDAERAETHLIAARPPLHANAAAVMFLAARRYDALGRRYQIAQEVRRYYGDASVHPADGLRDLFWCKYWFWEQRDSDEDLLALYATAWRYESRSGHLESNLERYHRDAQRAIARADAVDRVTYQYFVARKPLPPLDDVLFLRNSCSGPNPDASNAAACFNR
ncbi:MAG: beta-N-acetylhexosaminidase [Candidatus Eremiobacteraeota bacterium]|nr:beta-N-acetylhexosaminidase [Candidatus Eremiobacteraeota bacterium]